MMAVGRVLPGPEIYIDGSLATMFCRFLYSDVNCETLYDTLFYIDMFVFVYRYVRPPIPGGYAYLSG